VYTQHHDLVHYIALCITLALQSFLHCVVRQPIFKASAKKKKQLKLVTGRMALGDGPSEADRPSEEVGLTAVDSTMMIAPEVQVDDTEMDEQGGELDLMEDREEPDAPTTPVAPPADPISNIQQTGES
jgi:hypothetical protein